MKSIFDGWTKKVEFTICAPDGSVCARGWIHGSTPQDKKCNPPRTIDEERIGRWIQANMNPPYEYRAVDPWTGSEVCWFPLMDPIHALIWANNSKALDIEGFKMVDLLSQGFVPEEASEPACEPVLAGI